MKKTETIGITFGLLAPDFKDQDVGKILSAKQCQDYQDLSLDVSRLRIHGIIPDAEAKKAWDRLYKKMASSVKRAMKKRKSIS